MSERLQITYSTGVGTLVVSDALVALVHAPPSDDIVRVLRTHPPDVSGVYALLSASPDLRGGVVVQRATGASVLISGEVAVSIDGTALASAGGRIRTAELEPGQRLGLRLGDAAPAASWYELEGGSAPASEVIIGWRATSTRDVEPHGFEDETIVRAVAERRPLPEARHDLISMVPRTWSSGMPNTAQAGTGPSTGDDFTVARVGQPGVGPQYAPAASVPAAMVRTVRCPVGHPNPLHIPACRSCGSSLTHAATELIERPALGSLRFEDGRRVVLDRPVVIGRTPPAAHEVDGELARPFAIDDQSMSRVHAIVHLVDWFVQVSDQDSSNGTIVHWPGRAPQRLRPFERITLSPNVRIAFGTSVECTFVSGSP